MNRQYKPNRFKIKEDYRKRKTDTPSIHPPVTVHIFQYFKFIKSPKTKIRHFTVNPNTELDLIQVRDKLNEYFPCLVDIRSVWLTPWFDVILDDAMPWGVVCELTLKAIGEIVE